MIQKPKLTIGYDCNNRPMQVYRAKLSDGSYLDIDAVLALDSGNIKRFCEAEIIAAEPDFAITDATWGRRTAAPEPKVIEHEDPEIEK